MRELRGQRGLAMMSVLLMVFVLAVLSALILYLSGKEIALTAVRRTGAQSLYIAEGGATATRSAMMAMMNADPIGVATIDPSLSGTTLFGWYAGGIAANQNPFGVFDYIVIDGMRYTLNPNPSTGAITMHLSWNLPTPHRKLLPGMGTPPSNTLGAGRYSGQVLISRRAVAHASCVAVSCYIHRLAPDDYEYFFSYAITSDGQMPPRARRRVTLSGDFSIRVRRQNFAQYSLFTSVHTTPGGGAIWFTSRASFDGPVHTNGEFRFAFFPKFGTPDPTSPCTPAEIGTTVLTSVSTQAWFGNNGSPVRRAANENVVGGVRRDAPVAPDCTPSTLADDNDNPPANFTRGVASIPLPADAYSQKGVSIGRDPADTSPVTNLQIRQAVPELADNSTPVPNGIYVPVTDAVPNGSSDSGEPLAGGIYVQGDLDSLTLSLGGGGNTLAVYTLVQGVQTVTVTVDRTLGTTTVTNSSWGSPATRTFAGVPKGWQVPGSGNSAIIYVEGNILSLGGTLEEKEQTTIASSGRIDISNHLQYEDPPVVTDPNDNPLNLLGLYSSSNDIRITTAAPNDLVLHAVLMAGNAGDGFNSSVNVQNYNSGSPRGTVNLIGGIVEEYYGPFGTFNLTTGATVTGYDRNFRYDRRMGRGFSPPYFPTTNRFEIAQGTAGLAGARPIWREASP